MKISKTTGALLAISFLVTIFDIARLDMWGTTNLLYLIWNLFLAWVPYIISTYFIKTDTPTNTFILLFVLWLLFFPNAPYLVTDILHLVSSLPSQLWYDSLLLFLFGWIGLLLGMLSLFQIHTYLKAHITHTMSEVTVFGICLISSFGIYLGRFERWNSWDIFINPRKLIEHSINISANLTHAGTPLTFIVVFSISMYLVYKTVYILVIEK